MLHLAFGSGDPNLGSLLAKTDPERSDPIEAYNISMLLYSGCRIKIASETRQSWSGGGVLDVLAVADGDGDVFAVRVLAELSPALARPRFCSWSVCLSYAKSRTNATMCCEVLRSM
jgi:hypothetical protein